MEQCISIKRHVPPCVSVSWAGCRYGRCHFYGGKRDIFCLGGTNFLLMDSVHLHNSQPCSHPHKADGFIIVCQESAGFIFQQNGTIWWANRCTLTSIATLATACQLISSPLPLSPPLSANLPAHSGAAGVRLRMYVSVTSFLSDFILFYFYFFGRVGRGLGEEQTILTLNHSVSILNVLRV